MSNTSARRKQRRAMADQQAETLARFVLRSEAGSARPSDEAWTRLQARVGATPRPVRQVVPPPSRLALWWRSFMTTAPAMSARLSSVSAAALLLIMLAHGTLSTLAPLNDSSPISSSVRAPYDALTVVERRSANLTVVDTSREDQRYEAEMQRPRPANSPVPQNLTPHPVYLPLDTDEVINLAPVTEKENLSTLVPPQSLPPNQLAVWTSVPDTSGHPYAGALVR